MARGAEEAENPSFRPPRPMDLSSTRVRPCPGPWRFDSSSRVEHRPSAIGNVGWETDRDLTRI